MAREEQSGTEERERTGKGQRPWARKRAADEGERPRTEEKGGDRRRAADGAERACNWGSAAGGGRDGLGGQKKSGFGIAGRPSHVAKRRRHGKSMRVIGRARQGARGGRRKGWRKGRREQLDDTGETDERRTRDGREIEGVPKPGSETRKNASGGRKRWARCGGQRKRPRERVPRGRDDPEGVKRRARARPWSEADGQRSNVKRESRQRRAAVSRNRTNSRKHEKGAGGDPRGYARREAAPEQVQGGMQLAHGEVVAASKPFPRVSTGEDDE